MEAAKDEVREDVEVHKEDKKDKEDKEDKKDKEDKEDKKDKEDKPVVRKLEFNVAVVGEVDAAKSTLIGVICSGIADDGRGSARLEVLSLKHEKESGRTSNINTVMWNSIRFLDLAGHERYLNMTLEGLTGYFPQLALLVIAGNRGITPMTKEHFRVCYSLHIPILVVFTKIDMTPPNILKETIDGFKSLVKSMNSTTKIFFYPINDVNSSERALKAFDISPTQIMPFFKVSNITMAGISQLKEFLVKIPIIPVEDAINRHIESVNSISASRDSGNGKMALFIVYKPYLVNGVGLVVFGVNRGKPIEKGAILMVGPFRRTISGAIYVRARVRSLQNAMRVDVDSLDTGASGCLALKLPKSVTKNDLKRVVVTNHTISCTKFIAEVWIFSHKSTITVGYNPYIHCGNVSVSSRIIAMSKTLMPFSDLSDVPRADFATPAKSDESQADVVRSGDHVFIEFKLMFPSYIMPGTMIVFREGGLRGAGVVTLIS